MMIKEQDEQLGKILETMKTEAYMVLIEGGTVKLDGNKYQRTSSSFYLAKYRVTVGEFRRFVDSTGYISEVEEKYGVWDTDKWITNRKASWKKPYYKQEDNHPVVLVSWNDAVQYCNWLSLQEGLEPAYMLGDGKRSVAWKREPWKKRKTIFKSYPECSTLWNTKAGGYRLPTDSEWDYAFYSGNIDGHNKIKIEKDEKISPVGSFGPDKWGLYDMLYDDEWVWDYYGDSPVCNGDACVAWGPPYQYESMDYDTVTRLARSLL